MFFLYCYFTLYIAVLTLKIDHCLVFISIKLSYLILSYFILSVLTLHAMRNSKKSKMVKTSENDYQTLQHTCIGTFNNPLSPFRNLSSHIVLYPPFRHQLPIRQGHTCTMETFLLVIQFCLCFQCEKMIGL